jgi:hypothetical protein
MKMKEIVNKAQGLCISPTGGMGKRDLIHAIQKKEGYSQCYGTDFDGCCDRRDCLWLADCVKDSQSMDV